jgi:3-hydroxymyristoyl/3-hydroxydecanoyl-(acyl carrier protein) dehydratase
LGAFDSIRKCCKKVAGVKWYSITHLNHSSSNEILADVEVMPDSPWFSGHFPGDPILPGIAQLAMVFDVIDQLSDQNLKISGIRNVKFKQIIKPNDNLRIIATPRKENATSFSFRVIVKGEVACSGILIMKRVD